jgi:hypothetical protein
LESVNVVADKSSPYAADVALDQVDVPQKRNLKLDWIKQQKHRYVQTWPASMQAQATRCTREQHKNGSRSNNSHRYHLFLQDWFPRGNWGM